MANGARCTLPWTPATSDIRAVEFTPSRDGDGPVLPDLLGQIPNAEHSPTASPQEIQTRQTAEIHIRVALMNSFNALGTAEIVRMA